MARVNSVKGTAMLCCPARSITGATTAGPRKPLAKKESENTDLKESQSTNCTNCPPTQQDSIGFNRRIQAKSCKCYALTTKSRELHPHDPVSVHQPPPTTINFSKHVVIQSVFCFTAWRHVPVQQMLRRIVGQHIALGWPQKSSKCNSLQGQHRQ